ncbi:MAG: histidine kinase dimerization/phospho-acceptor domain-containing protein, partial [Bacteroidota bacterium]
RIAQRIDAGETDRQIRVLTRAAEIQDLARSLNSMAQRFRGEVGELQRMQQIQNEFIGNVSHEVKNPIFAVSGYLEALGSSDLPPDLRQRYA